MLFGKILFIYQIPKTGSQTVEATLARCSLPHTVLRFHYASREMEDEMRRGPLNHPDPVKWRADAAPQIAAMQRIRRIVWLRRFLKRSGFPIPPIEVISAVREPIATALSSVFENLLHFFPNIESVTCEGCAEIVQRPRMMNSIQNWFERELEGVLGLDVLGESFPREKGWRSYETRFIRVLVYRFDALSALPVMLKEFLGCEVKEVVNENLGTSKPYAAVYGKIKAAMRLPENFVRSQYASPTMRHFYLEAERESMARRWSAASLETARRASK